MTIPVSVDSNSTGLSFAEETSLKVVSGAATWYGLEPNTYPDFGASFTQVARETINSSRQRLKGTITDESAKGGFNTDLTQRNLTRLLQGFFFADALEKPATQPLNGTQVPITSVSTTQYLAGAGLAVFLANHLVSAKNFNNSGNNGLKHLTASASGTVTSDTAGLVAEASPPATAQLEAVGYRATAGDLHIAIAGSKVNLSSTTLDFTTLGLNVGEWVFLGGDAAINNFTSAPTNNQGYARIYSVAAHLLVFDLTMFVPIADADGGGLQKVDIYFGKVLVNAPLVANIKRRTYQLERTLGNDGVGTQAEYLIGAVADQFTVNLATAAKITADLSFIASDAEVRTGATGVKTGTRVGLPGEAAINTTSDVAFSRLAVVDPTTLNPTALYGYCSNIKLVINNNASLVKAIGVLGGFNITVGDFAVSGTMTAYFQTIAAISAIKANSDVCIAVGLAKNNAGMVFDVPLCSLGGGLNKVVKDKPIDVDITQDAAKNVAGYTFLACFFEYLPTVAM